MFKHQGGTRGLPGWQHPPIGENVKCVTNRYQKFKILWIKDLTPLLGNLVPPPGNLVPFQPKFILDPRRLNISENLPYTISAEEFENFPYLM